MLHHSSEEKWVEWNKLGFIPGPEESEEEFSQRVDYCQNLPFHLTQQTRAEFPFKEWDEESNIFLEEAFPLTEELYGIKPTWVPLFFSNYQLSPWHGGCAWIFQLKENSPTAAFLQLRAAFRQFPLYLKLYKRKELMAHELSHVGRMVYEEPHFEEVLAYQSSSGWRKWLGPLVQSSKESLFFIILLGFVMMVNLALLSVGSSLAPYAWMIPLLIIFLGLVRLWKRHRSYRRCLTTLCSLMPEKKARHLIYRLRDEEIEKFSWFSPFQIEDFIHASSLLSFRWNFLKTVYFK